MIDQIMAALAGHGRGRLAKRQEEQEAAALADADQRRERDFFMRLGGQDGFSVRPGAPEMSPEMGSPLDAVGGAVGGPPPLGGGMDAMMGPPPGGAMEIPGLDVEVSRTTPVGSFTAGGSAFDLVHDPEQTAQARAERVRREETTRQNRAWSQLPRDEYPVFVEGFDYLREMGEHQKRVREEKEIEAKRPLVARKLGLPVTDPTVEMIVRYNMDPQTYINRRKETGGSGTSNSASNSASNANTRLAWEREDRERKDAMEEAQGIANHAAQLGQTAREILTTLRAAGFHHKLSDGAVLGIIAKATKEFYD